mgnify:FL=1
MHHYVFSEKTIDKIKGKILTIRLEKIELLQKDLEHIVYSQ